jgi:hypothetical protein
MIEKHIVNIGFPRTGTTWLWKCAGFDPAHDKENNILTTDLDFDQYVKYYSQYHISANFNPSLWCVDREIIKFIHQHATHITVIVRDPFDFIERLFDFVYRGEEVAVLIKLLVFGGFINYKDIVNRWSVGAVKFKVLFFEDLEHDPVKFFNEYMDFCQISIAKNKIIDYNVKVNANPKQEKIRLNFTGDQIKFINQEIDRFQTLVDRDLTHWKK